MSIDDVIPNGINVEILRRTGGLLKVITKGDVKVSDIVTSDGTVATWEVGEFKGIILRPYVEPYVDELRKMARKRLEEMEDE